MDDRGTYIQLFRKITTSAVFEMPPLYMKIWIWILTHVDHKTGKTTTTLSEIAKQVGWMERGAHKTPSKPTVSKILKWLEEDDTIFTEVVYRVHTAITVIKWDEYQNPIRGRLQDKGAEALQKVCTTEEGSKNLEEESPPPHVPIAESSDPVDKLYQAFHQKSAREPMPAPERGRAAATREDAGALIQRVGLDPAIELIEAKIAECQGNHNPVDCVRVAIKLVQSDLGGTQKGGANGKQAWGKIVQWDGETSGGATGAVQGRDA